MTAPFEVVPRVGKECGGGRTGSPRPVRSTCARRRGSRCRADPTSPTRAAWRDADRSAASRAAAPSASDRARPRRAGGARGRRAVPAAGAARAWPATPLRPFARAACAAPGAIAARGRLRARTASCSSRSPRARVAEAMPVHGRARESARAARRTHADSRVPCACAGGPCAPCTTDVHDGGVGAASRASFRTGGPRSARELHATMHRAPSARAPHAAHSRGSCGLSSVQRRRARAATLCNQHALQPPRVQCAAASCVTVQRDARARARSARVSRRGRARGGRQACRPCRRRSRRTRAPAGGSCGAR
jgi:hypothetical protein